MDVSRRTLLAATAGLATGLCPPPESFGQSWQRDRRFTPALATQARDEKYAGWKDAVKRTLSTAQ